MPSVYITIRDTIRKRIADGTYVHQIPTASVLAKEFGVDPSTVAQAVRALKAEGLLVWRGRAGTLISGQVLPSDLDDLKVLTVAEVAAVLRVGQSIVYQLIRDGELVCFRGGPKRMRVPEHEVQQYLLDNYQPPVTSGVAK